MMLKRGAAERHDVRDHDVSIGGITGQKVFSPGSKIPTGYRAAGLS